MAKGYLWKNGDVVGKRNYSLRTIHGVKVARFPKGLNGKQTITAFDEEEAFRDKTSKKTEFLAFFDPDTFKQLWKIELFSNAKIPAKERLDKYAHDLILAYENNKKAMEGSDDWKKLAVLGGVIIIIALIAGITAWYELQQVNNFSTNHQINLSCPPPTITNQIPAGTQASGQATVTTTTIPQGNITVTTK